MTDKNKHTGGSSQRQDGSGEKSEKGAQKAFKKEDSFDPDEEPVREADFGSNVQNDPNSQEKRIQIDDDPDEIERKIPHMNN